MRGPGHTRIMFPSLETDVAGEEVLALVLISWVTRDPAAASFFYVQNGHGMPILPGFLGELSHTELLHSDAALQGTSSVRVPILLPRIQNDQDTLRPMS